MEFKSRTINLFIRLFNIARKREGIQIAWVEVISVEAKHTHTHTHKFSFPRTWQGTLAQCFVSFCQRWGHEALSGLLRSLYDTWIGGGVWGEKKNWSLKSETSKKLDRKTALVSGAYVMEFSLFQLSTLETHEQTQTRWCHMVMVLSE